MKSDPSSRDVLIQPVALKNGLTPPLGIITAAGVGDFNAGGIAEMRKNHPRKIIQRDTPANVRVAVFAGGCFQSASLSP